MRTGTLFYLAALSLLLTGCGSTWTAKEVGRGMQLGSIGGSGGWLAPIVWGAGFVIEQVGEAVSIAGSASTDEDSPEIIDVEDTSQSASQPVD